MIDSLGDVGAALSNARPESLSQLYQSLRLGDRPGNGSDDGVAESLAERARAIRVGDAESDEQGARTVISLMI